LTTFYHWQSTWKEITHVSNQLSKQQNSPAGFEYCQDYFARFYHQENRSKSLVNEPVSIIFHSNSHLHLYVLATPAAYKKATLKKCKLIPGTSESVEIEKARMSEF
jgi:hypothetical protein